MGSSAFTGAYGGGGSSITTFSSQTSVTVTHNFNTYPVVDVVDDTGAVLIPMTITHNSAAPSSCTATTVTFDVAKSGKIVLSYGAIPGATGAQGQSGSAWTTVTGTYASTTTFTYAGTAAEAGLAIMSLVTCTDTTGATRRIGYIKSTSILSGTITATVVMNSDLVNTDKDFKILYGRKVTDYMRLVTVPGECIADASYSQGMFYADIQVDSYLLPVDTSVLTAAAGTGAALTYNVYKGSTNLFSAAPDMTTNTVLRSQRPTTNTISAGDNISLRIMSSAGATNKAADFQAKLYIVPQAIFTAF